jgi:hypothetical protein
MNNTAPDRDSISPPVANPLVKMLIINNRDSSTSRNPKVPKRLTCQSDASAPWPAGFERNADRVSVYRIRHEHICRLHGLHPIPQRSFEWLINLLELTIA